MCSGDYEQCDIWNDKWRTRRKECQCYECGKTICVGERYRDIQMLFDGKWWISPTCMTCSATWDFVMDDGCVIPGMLFEHIYEAEGDDFVVLNSRMAAAQRAKYQSSRDTVHESK